MIAKDSDKESDEESSMDGLEYNDNDSVEVTIPDPLAIWYRRWHSLKKRYSYSQTLQSKPAVKSNAVLMKSLSSLPVMTIQENDPVVSHSTI